MVETIRYSQIGAEDLAVGTGTFEVDLADGRRVALSRINLATFTSTAVVNRGIYYADDNGNLTQAEELVFNDTVSPNQMLLDGALSVGLDGVTVAKGQIYAVNDGAVSIGIENTSSTVEADMSLIYYKNATGAWNISVDDSNADNLVISTGQVVQGTPHMMFSSADTSILIGTNTLNANNTAGITIDQGAADNEALALKSSDVAHGVTALTETDTYALFEKVAATTGGLLIQGYSEDEIGVRINGISTNNDTTESTAGSAPIVLSAGLVSGTNITAFAAADNIVTFDNNGTTRLIVKGDGDVEADGTVTSGSFDDHNDIQLLEAYKTIGNPRHRDTLGDWVNGHLDILEAGGVIRKYDGGYFVSTAGFRGLIVDALRQLASRVQKLETQAA